MMIDSHCHGEFSADSRASLVTLLEEARKKDMGFILTDHMDVHAYKDGRLTFDPKEYFGALECYRSERVGLGVELGLRHEAKGYFLEIIKEFPFDFILGSTHAPYRSYDDLEFTYRRLHEAVSVEACHRYFWENVIQGLEENPYIHALAHVDYLARYHKDLYCGVIPFESIMDLMEKAFKLMVQFDISLEINTARLDQRLAVKQWKKILSHYYDLGGRHVTLGSDAHVAEHLGRNFDVALGLAKESGLFVVSYRQQKRILL